MNDTDCNLINFGRVSFSFIEIQRKHLPSTIHRALIQNPNEAKIQKHNGKCFRKQKTKEDKRKFKIKKEKEQRIEIFIFFRFTG